MEKMCCKQEMPLTDSVFELSSLTIGNCVMKLQRLEYHKETICCNREKDIFESDFELFPLG